ncbi:MAG: Kelch repeat-containing protein [Planctomycetota bacterium]
MRIAGLIAAVALIAALAGGPLLAMPTRDPVGDWQGLRTMKLKAKGVKRNDSVPFTLMFGRPDDWRLADADDVVITGTWFRAKKNKLELELDQGSLEAIEDLIRKDVETTEFVIHKIRAKTKLGAVSVRLMLKIKFIALIDGKSRKGKWTLRANGNPDPSPDPTGQKVLVTQEQFRELAALMNSSRSSHSSTTLSDGRVLLAGGYASGTLVNASSEYFIPGANPGDEQFLTGPPLVWARASHTATVLESGDILLVGGDRSTGPTSHNSAEIYDVGTDTFRAVPSMLFERTFHDAVRLEDGRVLVLGGLTVEGEDTVFHRSAEIFDPVSETWSQTAGDMAMLRAGQRTTLLPTGEVLVTGGSGNRVAEIFDPATGEFRTIDARMNEVRSLHAVLPMETGVFLITDGGAIRGELYDPVAETFTPTGNAGEKRRSAAVTFQFKPGEVLIYGGIDFAESFLHGTMEHFIHDYAPNGRYFHIPALPGDSGIFLPDPRAFSAASELLDGRFLITGGLGEAFDEPDLKTAVLFDPSE